MDSPLLISPIVGEVTDNQAIIVVESNQNLIYRLSCHNKLVHGSVDITDDTIFRLVLSDLKPKTDYLVHWYLDNPYNESYDCFCDNKNTQYGVIAVNQFTTTDVTGPCKIAVVSCDLPAMQAGTDLWNQLAEANVDLIIHIGDNVYMDGTFNRAIKRLNRNSRYSSSCSCCYTRCCNEQENEKIGNERERQRIRNVYRNTWNRSTWSNCANICIWDDHEFHNCFPSKVHDRQRHAFLLCMEAYLKYQRNLLLHNYDNFSEIISDSDDDDDDDYDDDDSDDDDDDDDDDSLTTSIDKDSKYNVYNKNELTPSIDEILSSIRSKELDFPPMGFERRWNNTLLLVTEYLSLRNQGNFMTDRWPQLRDRIFNFDGNRVILVSPKALLPMSTGLASIFIQPEFTTDQLTSLYRDLVIWLNDDKDRSILLIMGDMHLGACGTIRPTYTNVSIDFILTSPITNYPFWYEFMAKKAMRSSVRELNEFTINYNQLTCRRNFALINLHNNRHESEGPDPTVSSTVGRSSKPTKLVFNDFYDLGTLSKSKGTLARNIELELVVGSGRRPGLCNLYRGIRALL